MSLPDAQPSQLPGLRWRHYRWHLVVGLIIWAGLLAEGVLTQFLHEGSVVVHEPFYAHNQAETLYRAARKNAGLAFMRLVFGFVPAAIGGLIRFPVMERLCRRARSRAELT